MNDLYPFADERRDPELRDATLRVSAQLGAEATSDEDRVELLHRLLGPDLCHRLGVYRLPPRFLLSVVIPVYNEVGTIESIVRRVRACGIPCELIIVDDGSTDGTRKLLQDWRGATDLRIVFHEKNQGKGAALRTGLLHAQGDVVVFQDADSEYDPRDFRWLLQPIVEDRADVVYGSRFTNPDSAFLPLWHLAANRLVTTLFCLRHGRRLSDAETCYKMFRREVIRAIAPTLRECRFGIELEITAKLLRRKDVRFFERPISYQRRSYAQGKKIGWRDGLWALWCILRY
jgi:hypothetical protein